VLRGGGQSSQFHAGSIQDVYMEGRFHLGSGDNPLVQRRRSK
jgi:hypothetical protein